MCPQTLLDHHDQTKTDKALWFFFYWTTTDKLKFTDWSKVIQMFGCDFLTEDDYCAPTTLTRVNANENHKPSFIMILIYFLTHDSDMYYSHNACNQVFTK